MQTEKNSTTAPERERESERKKKLSMPYKGPNVLNTAVTDG